jgi:hypothetical protein
MAVHGRPDSPEDVTGWVVQGASMAVGRFVAGRMTGLIERMENVAERGAFLKTQAAAQRQRAEAVVKSGDEAQALDLLAAQKQLLDQETALLSALEQDAAARNSAGLSPEQLALLRRANTDAQQQATGPAYDELPFRLERLEEIVPGARWSGDPDQIRAALDHARRAGVPINVVSHDGATGRWDIRLRGRHVILDEKPHPSKPRAEDDSAKSADPVGAGRPQASDSEPESAPPDEREILKRVLAVDSTKGRQLIREYGDELTEYLRWNPLGTLRDLETTLAKRRADVKRQVKGLAEGIDTDNPPAGLRFDDHGGPRTVREGASILKVLSTSVYGSNGTEGYFERAYDPHNKVLELRMAFLKLSGRDKALPNMIGKQGDAPEMVPRKGTPTVQYITLYQMKKLGVPMGRAGQGDNAGIKTIHMSNIQNVETVVHLHWLREQVGGSLSDLVQHTSSVKYADTTAIQSGYRRSDVPILSGGGEERPIRELLEFQERGNAKRIAENDAILAKYGYDRNTAMKWGFDVDFSVSVEE